MRNLEQIDLSQATITSLKTVPEYPISHLTDGNPDTFFSSGSDLNSASWIKLDFKADHFNFGLVEVTNRMGTKEQFCNYACKRRLEDTKVEVYQYGSLVKNCGKITGMFTAKSFAVIAKGSEMNTRHLSIPQLWYCVP